MRRITLALAYLQSREELHTYLQEALELPDYYGGNLDALYDLLTENTEPLEITISEEVQQEEYLGDYGTQLLCVLQDAAAVNDSLSLRIE